MPAEKPWVWRAQEALKKKGEPDREAPWRSLREALERAKVLEAEGKKDEAKAIRKGLAALYRGDREAQALIAAP